MLSQYEVSEMLTCGDHRNFPEMLEIPFVSPVRRSRDAAIFRRVQYLRRQDFRGVPEVCVAWWEGWLLALWVTADQDKSGLFSPGTSSRDNLRKEGPGSFL